MSQRPSPKAQSSPAVKAALVRKTAARQKRGRLAKMCFGVGAVAVLIAVATVLATLFSTAQSPIVETTRSGAEPNTAGTIVLHSGTSACQQKTFNNQTGQISDLPSPCHSDVVVDAKGVPIPAGTLHTINSISKSFK